MKGAAMSRGDEIHPLEVKPSLVTLMYLGLLVIALAVYGFLHLFWSDRVLLTLKDLEGHGLVWSGLTHVWFIFVWGFGVTLLMAFIQPSLRSYDSLPRLLGRGWWISLNAGYFEEAIYRWLAFFVAMMVLPFFNLITFGLTKWLYTTVLIPLANIATLHALQPYLHHPGSWTFGAAIVSASIAFRDAHEHLGLFGWVNAWFGGMVMFWLMFNYGLLTAIMAHVIYDAIIFTVVALVATERPASIYSW